MDSHFFLILHTHHHHFYNLFTIAFLQSRVIQSTHSLLDHHDNCSVVDSSCFIALIIYQSSWYMPCILSLLCALLNFQNRLQCSRFKLFVQKSVHSLRPRGTGDFQGGHLFDPASGGAGFFWPVVRGARKNFDHLEGGIGFFCITFDKKFPKKGSKTPFLHVSGGLAHYVFRVEPSFGGGTAFNFHGGGGETRFFR